VTQERVEYYAIVGVGRTIENPSGLARRRYASVGRVDESLQRNLSWEPSSAVTQWEYGNLAGELVEISEVEAERLIEGFREKWSAQG
jgi:hypothetical protein